MTGIHLSIYLSVYLTYPPVHLSVVLLPSLPPSLLPLQTYWGENQEWGHKECYSLLLKQPIFRNKTSSRTHVVFGVIAPNITRTVHRVPLRTLTTQSQEILIVTPPPGAPLSPQKCPYPVSRRAHRHPCGIQAQALATP